MLLTQKPNYSMKVQILGNQSINSTNLGYIWKSNGRTDRWKTYSMHYYNTRNKESNYNMYKLVKIFSKMNMKS